MVRHVGVHDEDEPPLAQPDAVDVRRAQTKLALAVQDLDLVAAKALSQPACDLEGVVGRAVLDDHDLVRQALLGEDLVQHGDHQGKVVALVVDGKDHRVLWDVVRTAAGGQGHMGPGARGTRDRRDRRGCDRGGSGSSRPGCRAWRPGASCRCAALSRLPGSSRHGEIDAVLEGKFRKQGDKLARKNPELR